MNPAVVVFMSIVVILTLFSNVYIILSMILNKNLRHFTSFYLGSTSVTGVIVSFINMPFQTIYTNNDYNWFYGLPSCIIWYISDLTSCAVNLLSFMTVSYIRLKYLREPTKQWAPKSIRIILLISIWLVPFIIWAITNSVLMSLYPRTIMIAILLIRLQS